LIHHSTFLDGNILKPLYNMRLVLALALMLVLALVLAAQVGTAFG
jgi:hypothetical protein